MTVFGLALVERRLTGGSLSSGSKSVASMSMATDETTVTQVNTGGGSHSYRMQMKHVKVQLQQYG